MRSIYKVTFEKMMGDNYAGGYIDVTEYMAIRELRKTRRIKKVTVLNVSSSRSLSREESKILLGGAS